SGSRSSCTPSPSSSCSSSGSWTCSSRRPSATSASCGKVARRSGPRPWHTWTRTTADPPGATEHRSTPRMHDEARLALEAIVMVADEPADPKLLAQLVELSPAAVEEILGELAAAYEAENHGFQL